jgi:transposase
MKAKRAELITALDGRFDEHHGELARMLLSQIDALTTQIDTLSARIEELIAELPDDTAAIEHTDADPGPGAGADIDPDPNSSTGGGNPIRVGPVIEAQCALKAECALNTIERLDEVPGIGVLNAQGILAEIGTDMSRFPTPEHLVSWARLCPRTIQSGPLTRAGKSGKGNPYLKGALGQAAAAAAKTDTFLGERYRRLVKRRGKLKALVAVGRSILVIIWHLLSNPAARFRDLGPDYHTNRIASNDGFATTSPNSPPWATGSASNPPPNPNTQARNDTRLRKLRRVAIACPLTLGIFRSDVTTFQAAPAAPLDRCRSRA